MRRNIALTVVLAAMAIWAVAQTTTQRITSGPKVENVTSNSVVIAWSTDINSSSVVQYGTNRNNLDQVAEAPWGGVTHRVTLQNLQPGTVYYFRVTSGQARGNGESSSSPIDEFHTLGAR